MSVSVSEAAQRATTCSDEAAPSPDATTLHGDVAWLLAPDAAALPLADLVAGLCAHLVARGLPLDRVALTVGTVHPLLLGRSWVWRAGTDVEAIAYGHSSLENPEYRDSPNQILFEAGGELRWRLVGPEAPRDRGFVAELAGLGFTDYFGLRLPSRNAAWITVATRRPEGLAAGDLARIRAIGAALGLVVDLHTNRDIARTVLETYVGREAGERVLGGEIRRGHYQRRSAVIWLCDLRGFTAISEVLDGGVVVTLLNDYFERMAGAVRAHGGEILKFIGDAMLAVFPTMDGGPAAACGAAVAAARDALEAIDAWNRERAAADVTPVRVGIALHLGDVVYGNIGGTDRLDFTVIGAAVNRAARIEALTATLGCPVLASETVARHTGPLRSCGRHRLRGVPDAVELFTVPPW